MPLIAGLALNSATDEKGQRSTFCPFTISSKAMLPTAGTIETTVCARVSSRRTMSPVCFAVYGAAAAGHAAANHRTMVSVAREELWLRWRRIIGPRPHDIWMETL